MKGSTGFEGDISGGGVASVARSSSFIEVDIGYCGCNGDWWWLRVGGALRSTWHGGGGGGGGE